MDMDTQLIWEAYEQPKEKVIAAAARLPNGEIKTAPLHCMIEGLDGDLMFEPTQEEKLDKGMVEDEKGEWIQVELGFVTNTGRFLTRDEAAEFSGVSPDTYALGGCFTAELAQRLGIIKDPTPPSDNQAPK